MKHDAFIFDFDYTLGDATDGIVMSVNDALGKMELPESPSDRICKTIGLTLPEMFERLTGIHRPDQSEQFVKLFIEKADKVMTDNTKLYADTIFVLTRLKSTGSKIGIVTTKYRYRITEILEKYQIQHLVDVIVGIEDVKNPKPHPEALLTAINMLKVLKNDVLYIGDSEVDAQTAQRSGVNFMAVTTGTTEIETLMNYPHLAIAGSLSEFYTLYCQEIGAC
jgi:phosphoglycolate phosphatase